MKKYLLTILTIAFLTGGALPSFAQSFSLGIKTGGGSISGRSPAVGSYAVSVFSDFSTPFSEVVNFRAGFMYMEDFEKLLPGTSVPYFPFFKGFYLQGVISQPLSDSFFLEEAAGVTAINDRTFGDVNDWGYGIMVSFGAGIDLRAFGEKGWQIGAGLEYGITFTNTLPQFFGMNLFGRYWF